MEEKLTFEELYDAYMMCLKNKKRKNGTYSFVNEKICENLINLLDELNSYTYKPKPSNCYVITDPALREIYAAQFRDRIVQHFYLMEIENILENKFVDGCCSCRKTRGTDYALSLLKDYLVKTSKKGKKDCYFLKIDLSGYFMSIDRKQVSNKFENLRTKVPKRRKMNPSSDYGMAIGNLTAQAASNLNLNDFDNFVVNELGLKKYVRYVDDIIIISENKSVLIEKLPEIIKKLEITHQTISKKKTKIDTAYHGVQFLGKVSYPYGYQRPSKQVIIRTYNKAKKIEYEDKQNLIAKVNAQIGTLKKYNSRKLILNYVDLLPSETKKIITFNDKELKFN